MNTTKDSFGDRMKNYESIPKNYLMRRTPAIIRLDGKAFHTFTKGLDKPFDDILAKVMQNTMKYLCENIQGCVFGYTQSDEITLVLTDYATITTDAWFGYNVQKMTSVSASMATLAFNKFWEEAYCDVYNDASDFWLDDYMEMSQKEFNRCNILYSKRMTATFDSRVFSLPKEEVCNCLIWRQQDATRNSIEAVGQANFSQKELEKKSCDMVQDMLMTKKNINWNDFPVKYKRGTACYRKNIEVVLNEPSLIRKKWYIDENMPILTQDRNYVERWL